MNVKKIFIMFIPRAYQPLSQKKKILGSHSPKYLKIRLGGCSGSFEFHFKALKKSKSTYDKLKKRYS